MKLDELQKSICFKVSRRAKRINITVKPGGRVVATRPVWATQESVAKFLASKRLWIARAVRKMSRRKTIAGAVGLRGFKDNRIAAKTLALDKIGRINQTYGFRVGRVAIKNQASRWGSCSAKGNLNFNYRIALLPDNLAEYVVAHELCHLKELNHSPAFWDLVAKTIPDHRERRRKLRNIIFA